MEQKSELQKLIERIKQNSQAFNPQNQPSKEIDEDEEDEGLDDEEEELEIPEKKVETKLEEKLQEKAIEKPQEKVTEKPKVEEEKADEKIQNKEQTEIEQRIAMEIELLQNNGRYRAELLHQLQEINKSLTAIAGMLIGVYENVLGEKK